MTGYREQLESALRAVAVTPPTSYAWFGRRSRPLPRAVRLGACSRGRARASDRGPAERAVPIVLHPGKAGAGEPERACRGDRPGVGRALSRANSGTGGWQPGWRVETVERGTCASSGTDCRPRADLGLPRVSAAARRCAFERPPSQGAARSSPGFYTALGDSAERRSRRDIELRVYFKSARQERRRSSPSARALLNEATMPFELKVVDHPGGLRPLRRSGPLPGQRRLRARARNARGRSSRHARPTCTANRRHSRSRSPPGWPSANTAPAWARASGRAAAGWSPRASSPRTRAARAGWRTGSMP